MTLSEIMRSIALVFIKEKQVINCFDRQGEAVPEKNDSCYFCRKYLDKSKDGYFLIQDYYTVSKKIRSNPIKVKNHIHLAKLNAFPDHIESNSRVAGEIVWWYENGQKWHESNIVNGQYEGKFTEWYENGQKFKEYFFVNGEKEGNCTIWYANGQKYIENKYLNGEPEGVWTEWYENGQKYREGVHHKGEKEVYWRFWKEDGTELPPRLYVND